MQRINFHINKCIYCGGEGETDEHIIPFALGGTAKLFKASCEKCRNITSKYERNPLRNNWVEARAVLDYPSRKRDFGDEKFLLSVTFKNGEDGILELPKNKVLGLTPFLLYPLPAFFAPNNYNHGILVTGQLVISFGMDIKALTREYGLSAIRHDVFYKCNDTEIMIIRIAYCALIALLGVNSLDQCFVLPTIMGEKDDAGFWFGCDPEGKITPLIGKQNSKNVIKLGVLQKPGDKNRYIVVRLKFFASSDAPEYIVIIGTLKPDYILQVHQSIIL